MTVEKAVLMLSGGLESTVVAALFRDQVKDGEGHVLFVDYGQRPMRQELRACRYLAKTYRYKVEVVHLMAPFLRGHYLTNSKVMVEAAPGDAGTADAHILHGRNLMFLSICSAYARSIGAKWVWTGFDYEEGRMGAALDKSPAFAMAFNVAARTSGLDVKIHAPLQGNSKTDTIKEGLRLNIDWSKSWSCYNAMKKHARDIHCGGCGPCLARKESFGALGITGVDVEYRK